MSESDVVERRIRVIINPASGQPEPVLHPLNQVFSQHRVVWDVVITQQDGDGLRLAKEAVAEGIDVVAVYGGDGTVMDVANGLMGSSAPLAILPGGTGNLLAYELGIPRNLAEAAELIVNPQAVVRQIDVGYVGDRHFLLRMEVGFGAEAVSRTTRESKERFGVLAYAISSIETLISSEAVDYQIVVDGVENECRGRICSLTNASTVGLGRITYAPGISVDDGLLDVVVFGEMIFTELSAWVAKIGNSNSEERWTPAYSNHWQGREIRVTADPPQLVLVDGEEWGTTPVTVGVLPKALAVLVPPVLE